MIEGDVDPDGEPGDSPVRTAHFLDCMGLFLLNIP
eukprot:SAG31_NODE_114_length_24318_cov_16.787481_12_plen_35_part_00